VRVGAFAAAGVASLVFVSAAAGHGSVTPTVAAPGAVRQFTFAIANPRDDARMVGFAVELPAGATVEDVTARQPEWIASSTRGRVEWRGGPIPPRAFDSFVLRARMPEREGTATFVGRELFDDGPGPSFRLDVVLAGRSPGPGGEVTDEGARTLAKAALFVSIAAAILAAAGFFLGLGRWLRASS
jgi:hypothetical protein